MIVSNIEICLCNCPQLPVFEYALKELTLPPVPPSCSSSAPNDKESEGQCRQRCPILLPAQAMIPSGSHKSYSVGTKARGGSHLSQVQILRR